MYREMFECINEMKIFFNFTNYDTVISKEKFQKMGMGENNHIDNPEYENFYEVNLPIFLYGNPKYWYFKITKIEFHGKLK